jgi:hypothetical protein
MTSNLTIRIVCSDLEQNIMTLAALEDGQFADPLPFEHGHRLGNSLANMRGDMGIASEAHRFAA